MASTDVYGTLHGGDESMLTEGGLKMIHDMLVINDAPAASLGFYRALNQYAGSLEAWGSAGGGAYHTTPKVATAFLLGIIGLISPPGLMFTSFTSNPTSQNLTL